MKRIHRKAHGRIWMVLAVLLPALFVGTLLLRPDPSAVDGVGRLVPVQSDKGTGQ